MIRVGRCKYDENNKMTYPSFDNFTPIIIMMRSHSKYYELSPYELKNSEGHIMENIWQSAKVYASVPASKQYYSRYDKTVIWNHPKEIHVDENDNLTPEYWNWRTKLAKNKYPVRYPVGFNYRHNCLYALSDNDLTKKLNYIDGRKQIYMPLYINLAQQTKLFGELKNRLKSGENLLIIEVDGPHQEYLQYYVDTYGVDDQFIQNDTMLATNQNLDIMLNDSKHPFGHGYCIASALLN